MDSPCFSAASAMARATGCSDRRSMAAARRSASSSDQGRQEIVSVRRGRPSVSVPVLSKATVSTSASASIASALRKSMPSSAAFPEPTITDTGVANPMAQGQAMINTDTAATSANGNAGSGPAASHIRKAIRATASTAGANQATTRSARR